MIDNPNYSGVWAPKRIANPDYFEDKEPYKMTPIGAVAFELWSMTDMVLFDNILITDDLQVAEDWTRATWHVKRDAELAETAKNAVPMLQPLWDALEEMPWLYAVIIVGALLPIGLIFYCCVGSSKDETAEKKKTDAPSPDDEGAEAEADVDSQAAGDSAAPGSKEQPSPSKSGRSALNKPAEDDEAEEEEEEEAPPTAAPGDQSQEDDEEGAGSADQQEETTATRKSPRKRRPRKE